MRCLVPSIRRSACGKLPASGLPEAMIDQLKKPGDLNTVGGIALSEALNRAGSDDVCQIGDG